MRNSRDIEVKEEETITLQLNKFFKNEVEQSRPVVQSNFLSCTKSRSEKRHGLQKKKEKKKLHFVSKSLQKVE